ncbi:hypothetical protein BST61_g893 [Cercospora zeina]
MPNQCESNIKASDYSVHLQAQPLHLAFLDSTAFMASAFEQARSSDQDSTFEYATRKQDFPPFPYLPLSDPERRIQILHLTAAEQYNALVVAILKRTRVSEIHPNYEFELIEVLQTYEALSYSWGGAFDDDELADVKIVLSGHTVGIRGNLHNALHRLRYPDRARRLWVDALCINQDDVPERNGQVQSMETVYSSCAKVLVWLGEDTDILDGELIFSLATVLDQLRTLEPTATSNRPPTETSSTEVDTLNSEDSVRLTQVRKQLDEAVNNNAEANAPCCENFLARRYFSRR